MKRNIDDFNGMSDFIISMVTVIAWVLIGTIVTIGYFTIETKGESIMLSFTSTIFTIISSLGIVATISIYCWQKNDQKNRDNAILNRRKESIKHLIKISVSNFSFYINRFEAELCGKNIKNSICQLEMIEIKYIERCLIDSKDIDLKMFYLISNLLDAVVEQKEIIKKRVTNNLCVKQNHLHLTKVYCHHAKEEINCLYDCIIEC